MAIDPIISLPDTTAPFSNIKSVWRLASALRLVLVLVIVLNIFRIFGLLETFALLRSIRADPGAVSRADAGAVDSYVRLIGYLTTGAFVLTAGLVVTWFYPVRRNAGTNGWVRQRHAQGWSIGGWFCPIANYWYPFQMMVDVLWASEWSSGKRRADQSVPVLFRVWWSAWLLTGILAIAPGSRTGDSVDIGSLMTFAVMHALQAASELVAAALLIAVVMRISRAQVMGRAGEH
jgi:hypothetical protein